MCLLKLWAADVLSGQIGKALQPSKSEEKPPQVGGRYKLMEPGEIAPVIKPATPEQFLGLKAGLRRPKHLPQADNWRTSLLG